MRINSMRREEPYLGLTCTLKLERFSVLRGGAQVVHGCRQLVS